MLANILWVKALAKVEEVSLEQIEQLIQAQHNLLSHTLAVLVVIAGIIVVVGLGNWVYNVYFSRRMIRNLREDFQRDLEEARREFTSKLKATTDLMIVETHRIRALQAAEKRHWQDAVHQMTKSVQYLVRVRAFVGETVDPLFRGSVKDIRIGLDRCESLDDKTKAEIRKNIADLPEWLSLEREHIEKRLDELEKGIKETTGTT